MTFPPSIPMPMRPDFTAAPVKWVQYLRLHEGRDGRPCRVEIDDDSWQELSAVFTALRRTWVYLPDVRDTWGDAEGVRGDCDDFTMRLRDELAWKGWPFGALRPQLCRVRATGQGHLVLTVTTTSGDYIADLLDVIQPWRSRRDLEWKFGRHWYGQLWQQPEPR